MVRFCPRASSLVLARMPRSTLHRTCWLRPSTVMEPPTGFGPELVEWERGFALRSETWEWDGTTWTLNPDANLPGLIDPAVGYDEKRGRVVLIGGATSGWHCDSVSWDRGYSDCVDLEQTDVTYEYDGSRWVAREIPSAPEPRIRASMVWDSQRELLVLFGGRRMSPLSVQVKPHGPSYPDAGALELLNDTWLYDGNEWVRVPTGSPPIPRESAQPLRLPAW